MVFKNNKERLVCFRIQPTILAKLTMKKHVIIYLLLASSFTYAIPLQVKLDHSSETQLHTNQQLVDALKSNNKEKEKNPIVFNYYNNSTPTYDTLRLMRALLGIKLF